MTPQRPSGAHLNRNGDREAPQTQGGLRPQDEQVITSAREHMRAQGYPMALASVRNIYKRYMQAKAGADFFPYLLTYVDTTGETAVWNVGRIR